jgi:hypothetical protein
MKEGRMQEDGLEECVRNVTCQGDCHGSCRLNANQVISISDGDMSGSQSMQGHKGSAQDMLESFDWKHTTKESGVPMEKNLLESHSGLQMDETLFLKVGSGDDNVSVPVSKQTVQTHSAVVQQEYHGTGALHWTQVGGVVHEGDGVSMNSVDICQDGNILMLNQTVLEDTIRYIFGRHSWRHNIFSISSWG